MCIKAVTARVIWLVVLVIGGASDVAAHVAMQGLSLPQMIGITRFIAPGSRFGGGEDVLTSPDGKYVLALAQRGSLRSDMTVVELFIWRTRAIRNWLRGGGPRPGPVMALQRKSPQDFYGLGGPYFGVIRDVKWWGAADHILFRSRLGSTRAFGLYEASLDGTVRLLSRPDQDVRDYGVRKDAILYEVALTTPKVRRRVALAEDATPYFVGTGHSLLNLLFPASSVWGATDQVQVWMRQGAAIVRIPFERDRWAIRHEMRTVLSISPALNRVVMDLPVRYVPRQWDEYGSTGVPPWPHSGPVRSGDSDIWVPHEYVVADLSTGHVGPGVGAPDGYSRGFGPRPGDPIVGSGVSWSPDGRVVLLSNTFVPLERKRAQRQGGEGSRVPCLAVFYIPKASARCVTNLAKGAGQTLVSARWADTGQDDLLVTWKQGNKKSRARYCINRGSVNWIGICGRGPKALPIRRLRASKAVHLRVLQSLNSPPELVASIPGVQERLLFDPNGKLRDRDIGRVQSVRFVTGNGRKTRTVVAGLLLPVDYAPGHRYPMVIQTHGYLQDRFFSTGGMVPFAARAFAAAGMVVMQLPQCRIRARRGAVITYADQLPCNVRLFRSAIRYAVNRGYADPARIGIIGFSATCEQVLAALENSDLHFAAAELVSGVLNTYTQFVEAVDLEQGWIDSYLTPGAGESPFTERGLQTWKNRTPAFSMYKIRAPVLVEATGRPDVLAMWEPYAVLRYLGRPVDLVVMHSGTHPLSNPREQLASMRLGVEWFSYWLEHKRPSSSTEYERWSRLRRVTKVR